MTEGHEEFLVPHSVMLAKHEESILGLQQRMTNLDKLTSAVQELTVSFTKLVMNIEQQGKDLTIMVHTLERHEEMIERIEDKMETKDTVARLHGKVEEIRALINTEKDEQEQKKLSEYEDMKKFFIKTIVGAGLFVAASLIIFAVIVLAGLANAGALPTP